MELKVVVIFGTPLFIIWCVHNFINISVSVPPDTWPLILFFVFNTTTCAYPVGMPFWLFVWHGHVSSLGRVTVMVLIQERRIRMLRGGHGAEKTFTSPSALSIPSVEDMTELDPTASPYTTTTTTAAASAAASPADGSASNPSGKKRRREHRLERMIRQDSAFLAEFREFCIRSWCIESLNFILESSSYDSIDDDDKRRAAAGELFGRFLAADAPQELNLEEAVVEAAKERLARGDTAPDLFDSIRDHVIKVLYEDTFWRFNATRKRGDAGGTIRKLRSNNNV